MVQQGQQDLLALLELLVRLDRRVSRDHKVLRVLRESRGSPDQLEQEALLVQEVPLDLEDLGVSPVHQAPRVYRVIWARLAQKGHQVHQAPRVYRVIWARLVQKARPVHQAHREIPVPKGYRVT
ncbi:hypothetical protein KDAU_12460 [Dictyobacter aurantiacus]|uniref:Uncharacterized protein n=1 Tax=Dictyobacter aurantiacus TaxID=1936993 RepID=A0A401ZAM2_9CHLR|nr:hypothetical protein KDAU_12460 [Dictyobacter aurantiacus]